MGKTLVYDTRLPTLAVMIGRFFCFSLSLALPLACGQWTTQNQQILYRGNPVQLKGLNWYGFETGIDCIEGLWANPISYYMELMSNHSFNALRIPLSAKMIMYDSDLVPGQYLVSNDTTVQNKTWWAILDEIISQAEAHGIAVLLDMHRLKNGISTPLWFIPGNENYTETTFLQAWDTLINRYSDRKNLMGIELYNEPHGIATWGDNTFTDYKLFLQWIIPLLTYQFQPASFLFFFNGINWGKDMKLFGKIPLVGLDEMADRLVYSPHNYGPSINPNTVQASAGTLRADWDANFGYLVDMNKTLVITEWGGIYEQPQEQRWMDLFVEYMIDKNIRNNFFFALNPFASDVQGLLRPDWTTPKQSKLNLLQKLQPHPTKFNF